MRIRRSQTKTVPRFLIVETRWFIAWVKAPRFEPRDIWIGLFHDRVIIGSPGYLWGRSFYVCVVPCIVWKFDIWRKGHRDA